MTAPHQSYTYDLRHISHFSTNKPFKTITQMTNFRYFFLSLIRNKETRCVITMTLKT